MKERIINGGQSNGILSDDWFDVAWSFRFEDRIFSPKGEKGYSVIYLDIALVLFAIWLGLPK